jgi:hypothetical protein
MHSWIIVLKTNLLILDMTESEDERTSESVKTAQSINFNKEDEFEADDAGTTTAEQISENGSDGEIDDDDFGDFEEATVSNAAPIIEPEDPFPETPTSSTNENFGFAKFEDSPKLTPQRSFESPNLTVPSINDLISDNSFWEFDDPAASSMIEGSVDGVDYFNTFDDGKYSDEIELPNVYLNSLKLWSEICFVEDTAALKFQWNKSKLYGGMLAALNMNSLKATPKDTVSILPMLVPSSPLPLQLDLPETRYKPK